MKLGKLKKNTKKRDPRYFLMEELDLQLEEQETEKEFIKRFEKVVSNISDEEFVEMMLSEQEDKPTAPAKKQKEQLYLSKEAEKYVINFLRRRLMQGLSIVVRLAAKKATLVSFGVLPAVALPALKALGYGPRKLWRMTSTTGIDKIVEKFVKENMPSMTGAMYPGDTSLLKIAKAAFQEVVRVYKKEGQEIKKVAEQLPEPDRKSLEAEVAKQLEALGPFDVEVDMPKPEDKKQDGWASWDKKRTDPERYQRSPLYQRLVDKVKGGK
jgi:hypothetical protein